MRSSIVVFGCFVNCVWCVVVLSSNGNSERKPYHLSNVNYSQKTAKAAGDSANPKLDTELIVLPINPDHFHADQVMARLTAGLNSAAVSPLYDYSVYLGKPFVFNYTKALNDAIEQAKNEVLETNYNLDESKFAGAYDQPQRNDVQRFNVAEPLKPSALQVELFGTDKQGPRAEKLVRQPVVFPTAAANTLPIGLAFFDSLREQNNRPYSEAFAAPAFTFGVALNKPLSKPITTELPTTAAASVEQSDEQNDWIPLDQDIAVDSFEYNYNRNGELVSTSAEQDVAQEPDTNNKGNYEYRVIKTFSDSYGTKPAMKHSKHSQEIKKTTDKPHVFEHKKSYTHKRRNSQTTPAPADTSTSTPRSHFLYNDEVYHPYESRNILVVVDGKSEAAQHTSRSTRKRRQLDLPEGLLTFPQRHRPLSYRRQPSDDVESFNPNPTPKPMKPAPKKPKKANKPKKPVNPANQNNPKATTAPPVELRYFQ